MNYDNASILDWHFNTSSGHSRNTLLESLGLIPSFVFEADPRPAWEQFDERNVGGWNPMLPSTKGWRLDQNDYLHYPGDPALPPLAMAWLRDERIIVYPHAFVCIVQRDGSFSVARIN